MAIQQWVLTLKSCALLRFPNSPEGPFAFTLLTCSSKNIQVVELREARGTARASQCTRCQ